MAFDGLLIFLVIYLFWRINGYEKNLYFVNRRLKALNQAYLKSLPEEERQTVMAKQKASGEWDD